MTTTMDPPSIPGFRLGYPEKTPGLPFGDAPAARSMALKHRPRTLDDVVGQGAVVLRLQTFLECPHSAAFLFAGPTGVGKTSTALALAADLGVVEPSPDLVVIESGRQNGDAVEWILDLFRFPPMYGGWRIIIVNEADMMTDGARKLWLSGLESIPARTVIIFTTNHASKFDARFADRFEPVEFAADYAMLAQDAQLLIDRVWRAELDRTDSPRLAELTNVKDKDGLISFRRCVAALDPMIRDHARRNAPTASPSVPTVPFAAPARPDPLPSPATPPASKRRPPKGPTPRPPIPVPIPAPRPVATAPKRADVASLARVDGRLAELDAEYTRLGRVLLEMDRERAALRVKRKDLERRSKRARERG